MMAKISRKSRLFVLIVFCICLFAWIVLMPKGSVLADANLPTVTNSPVPTETPIPVSPTQLPPTETPDPYPQDNLDSIMGATLAPPPTSGLAGGPSTINRILIAGLVVVTVLVIGMIVYLLYNQTRGGGLDNRL